MTRKPKLILKGRSSSPKGWDAYWKEVRDFQNGKKKMTWKDKLHQIITGGLGR